MNNYVLNAQLAKEKGFYKLYPFTSENITGYIDSFDLNGRSLLTVGSSIDQVINANIKGVSSVTLLDIAPNTIYYYYLKLAALYSLNLDEFLSFLSPTCYTKFYRKNNDLLSIETYKKIKDTLKSLDIDAYNYWDKIFNTLSPNNIANHFFINDVNDIDTIRKSNPYLKNDILYDQAKEKMKSAKTIFITEDIANMELKNKYDNIWFSNIVDYIDAGKYVRIINKVKDSLEENGTLLIAYLYSIFFSFDSFDIIRDNYNLKKLRLGLSNHGMDTEVQTFNGVRKGKKDGVLIYKKH